MRLLSLFIKSENERKDKKCFLFNNFIDHSSQGFLHNGIIAGQARGVMIETLKDEIMLTKIFKALAIQNVMN